jgi:hypothetical protein
MLLMGIGKIKILSLLRMKMKILLQLIKKVQKRKKNSLMKIKIQKLKVKLTRLKMNRKVNMLKWKKIKNLTFNSLE